eukprot:COSAG06_NODE_113_length_23458_cov_74.739715_16_plen_77_part_00
MIKLKEPHGKPCGKKAIRPWLTPFHSARVPQLDKRGVPWLITTGARVSFSARDRGSWPLQQLVRQYCRDSSRETDT